MKHSNNKKDYDAVWVDYPDGFGPPSAEMLTFCGKGEGRSIIDIASGNGRYALKFIDSGFSQVTALEISAKGCELISNAAGNTDNLEIIQADLLHYETDKQYDVVFCSGLLAEIDTEQEQIALVHAMQKLTKKGGVLVSRQCLYLSDYQPQERIRSDLTASLFRSDQWHITLLETDPEPSFNGKSAIENGRNSIQRQTIVALKYL